MDNLETIMQSKSLTKRAVFEYLVLHKCPDNFSLPSAKNEGRCRTESCTRCWIKALGKEPKDYT